MSCAVQESTSLWHKVERVAWSTEASNVADSPLPAQTAHIGRLATIGITPIVVVPAELFDGLCRVFGLYRFERLRLDNSTNIASVEPPLWQRLLLIIGLLVLGTSVVAFLSGDVTMMSLVSTIGLAVAVGCGLSLEEAGRTNHNRRNFWSGYGLSTFALVGLLNGALFGLFDASLALIAGTAALLLGCLNGKILESLPWLLVRCHLLPRRWLLARLWPDQTDVVDHWGKPITINFQPGLPEEFDQLRHQLAAHGLKPGGIAAFPEAIGLANTHQLALKELAWIWDPVLYDRSPDGATVAILATVGEFPGEDEVVAWARREGLRLSRQ